MWSEKMEKGRTFETMIGLFVIIVAIFFFNYVYTKSGWKKSDGYVLTAIFDKADGLTEGTDVKISGVRVGKVLETTVDPKTFMATVKFYVSHGMELPKDTGAAVQNDGLLGSKYLALIPGGDNVNLKEGETIENTSGAINLESLIGNFVFSKSNNDSENINN
jgi:phospholipid/cholesterol/gamma-HCH transport system substrate-binding protein